MSRLLRSTVLLFVNLLLLVLAGPLLASDDAPRFRVERIDVRNLHHASPEIVVSESRLRAGETYSERELRIAADRIARLPFVLETDFALEKGSVRDVYVLVITVTEAKPFFYLVDTNLVVGNDNYVVGATRNRAAVGIRFFTGRHGVVHAGLVGQDDERPYTRDYTALEAGYTHYDILGTHAFATLSLRRPLGAGPAEAATLPQLLVSVPISPNQTVTALYSATDVGSDSETRTRTAERLATVRLSYNTTNHPFFPTRGVLLTFAPVVVWTDQSGPRRIGGAGEIEPFIDHSRSLAIEGTMARYWELTDRNSVSATVDGGAARVRSSEHLREGTTRFGSIDAGFSRRYSAQQSVMEGESRFELHVSAYTKEDIYFRLFRDETLLASIAWVKRNAWGSVRLGVGYAW